MQDLTWLEPQNQEDPIPDTELFPDLDAAPVSFDPEPTAASAEASDPLPMAGPEDDTAAIETPASQPASIAEDAPTMQIPELPKDSEAPFAQPTARIPDVSKSDSPKEPPAKKTTQAANKSTKIGLLLGIIAGALVLTLVLGVLIYGIVLKSGKTIYPNVYVAGINVGGMDRETAIEAVDDAIASTYASSTLKVLLPDRTLSFTPDKTNVALDAGEAIDEALAYGRDGNPFSAVTYYLSGKEHYVDLQKSMDLDVDYIRTTLEQVAEEAETSPAPSTASYNEATEVLTINVGYPERSLNVDDLYDVVYNAFMNNDFNAIQWQYDEVPTVHMDLTEYFEKYCTAVQDATFDAQTRTIIESVDGYGFDIEKVERDLDAAAPGSKMVIRMTDLEPEITTEVLEAEMFGVELFAHSTEYVINANRTKNLTLACEAINGLILNPGDEFSFNNVVGERTAAKGYLPATVYNGGQSVEELGGGVCQVASTLYYCTLHLDLEQVHREPHVYVVTYVPKGMDATVYWGQIDYKFKNTLDFPIRILANTDDGCVNITFQGSEQLDYSVKMEETILGTYPWQEVEKLDETKEPGYRQVEITPYTGYKVVTHKLIFDANGNEISREEEAVSIYSKRDQTVIVGPEEVTPPSDDPFDPDLWGPDPGEDPDNEPTPPVEEDPGTQSPWPDIDNSGDTEGSGGDTSGDGSGEGSDVTDPGGETDTDLTPPV